MAELSLGEAAKAAGGRVARGDAAAEPTGYSIDSRSVQPGDLFFALVGPNHDGHRFAAAAAAAGACAVVASVDLELPEGTALLRVADTTAALQQIASHVRQREKVKIIGITGSAGKTTAKELTFATASTLGPAYRSQGNLNNLYGLPLSLLRMPPGTQVAVLEMGMSYAGELRRLTRIARPDVGVLLNVGRAHLQNFVSQEAIALAKAELFEEMGARGTGIFNADDELVSRVADRFPGFTFTFGIEREADLRGMRIEVDGLAGTRFQVQHGEDRFEGSIGLIGVHHVYNALAALAAGYMLGGDLQEMLAPLAGVSAAPGRGERRELADGVHVIDETYNSNPSALRRAIAALVAAAPSGSRRVLITGDMLELGEGAREMHREAGRHAAEARLEMVVAVGELSAETAAAAREGGVPEVHHCGDSAAAAAAIGELVRPGDTLLVKGSRGMTMERVVKALVDRAVATE